MDNSFDFVINSHSKFFIKKFRTKEPPVVMGFGRFSESKNLPIPRI